VSDLDREHARALSLDLLAACQPDASGPAPVSDSFRCWTPLQDWASGAEGLSALRQVLRACAAAVAGAYSFNLNAVISDGQQVVIEADARAERGGSPVNCTFVLVLRAGLVDEVRCYLDPRVVEG
jgi:hypothetical protein